MIKYFVISIMLFIFTINIGFGNNNNNVKAKHNHYHKPNIEHIFNNYNSYGKYYGFDIKIDVISIIVIQTIHGNVLFYPIIEK